MMVDMNHVLMEGHTAIAEISTPQGVSICPGDSVQLICSYFPEYSWSSGESSQEIWVSEPGAYSVSGIIGATSFDSPEVEVALLVPAIITMTPTHPHCWGANTGSIAFDANLPLAEMTFNDYKDDSVMEDLPANDYAWTAIDSQGCVIEGVVTLDQPDSLWYEATVNDVLCFGENNGSVAFDVYGGVAPYSITLTEFSGLAAGEFSITLSDSVDCPIQLNAYVEPPTDLSVELSQWSDDGLLFNLSAAISGGIPDYQIVWTPGGAEEMTIYDQQPGDYSAVITDANGCVHEEFLSVVGIDETLAICWQLTPNPTTGTVRFLNTAPAQFQVRIYNELGQLVSEADHFGTQELELPPANGCYTVEIVSGGETFIQQIIVR
jgi:hypothetical protein